MEDINGECIGQCNCTASVMGIALLQNLQGSPISNQSLEAHSEGTGDFEEILMPEPSNDDLEDEDTEVQSMQNEEAAKSSLAQLRQGSTSASQMKRMIRRLRLKLQKESRADKMKNLTNKKQDLMYELFVIEAKMKPDAHYSVWTDYRPEKIWSDKFGYNPLQDPPQNWRDLD
jgi:hypothetical protein